LRERSSCWDGVIHQIADFSHLLKAFRGFPLALMRRGRARGVAGPPREV
jgi:hypothetical protein